MLANQCLGCRVHGLHVQRGWHPPGQSGIKAERRAAIDDAIVITPPGAIEAGVPIGGLRTIDNGYRLRLQPGVDRLHQAERCEGFCDIGMGRHGACVDAGIGTARRMNVHRLARHLQDRLLDGGLHRWAMILPLPAKVGPTIIFHGETETGHASGEPAGTRQPLSRALTGMAGLPAR